MTNMCKHLALLSLVAVGLTGCKEHKASVDEIMNSGASITQAELKENPLAWRVVTSFTNRDAGTMSTLYGNDAAVDAARAGHPYAANAVLALVTWRTKEDPHWFGGNIPSKPTQVEFLHAYATGPDSIRWNYSSFRGEPLQNVPEDAAIAQQRTDWISGQKAAYMP
jgi:hypothetical protein